MCQKWNGQLFLLSSQIQTKAELIRMTKSSCYSSIKNLGKQETKENISDYYV